MCIAAVKMMLICVGGREQSSFLPRPIAQPNSYAQFGQRYRQVAYSAENKDGGHRKVCGLPIAIRPKRVLCVAYLA